MTEQQMTSLIYKHLTDDLFLSPSGHLRYRVLAQRIARAIGTHQHRERPPLRERIRERQEAAHGD